MSKQRLPVVADAIPANAAILTAVADDLERGLMLSVRDIDGVTVLAVRGELDAPLSAVDEQKLPLDPRKTYAGQAKAQRAKGFEHVDITFEESTPPQDPGSGPR